MGRRRPLVPEAREALDALRRTLEGPRETGGYVERLARRWKARKAERDHREE